MNKVKDRIFYFDVIRALAILLVLLVHTSKWFGVNQTPHTLLDISNIFGKHWQSRGSTVYNDKWSIAPE